jgi:hypothetical protein
VDEHRDITTTIGTITKRLVQLCTWPADDNGGICGRRAVATYIQWTFDGTGSMRYPRCRRHDTHDDPQVRDDLRHRCPDIGQRAGHVPVSGVVGQAAEALVNSRDEHLAAARERAHALVPKLSMV